MTVASDHQDGHILHGLQLASLRAWPSSNDGVLGGELVMPDGLVLDEHVLAIVRSELPPSFILAGSLVVDLRAGNDRVRWYLWRENMEFSLWLTVCRTLARTTCELIMGSINRLRQANCQPLLDLAAVPEGITPLILDATVTGIAGNHLRLLQGGTQDGPLTALPCAEALIELLADLQRATGHTDCIIIRDGRDEPAGLSVNIGSILQGIAIDRLLDWLTGRIHQYGSSGDFFVVVRFPETGA